MDKKSLRKEIINKRDLINKEEKIILDKIIKEKLKKTEEYKSCKNIFMYLGFGSEIDTMKYVESFIKDEKNIAVPYTDLKNKKMYAIKIDSLAGLVKNKFGILEPINIKDVVPKNDIDLIIMPGVAFDENGNRIGYGGGYYDKYLSDLEVDIPKVALAYDIQVLESIPSEEHDIKVDFIITERKTIKCLKSK